MKTKIIFYFGELTLNKEQEQELLDKGEGNIEDEA